MLCLVIGTKLGHCSLFVIFSVAVLYQIRGEKNILFCHIIILYNNKTKENIFNIFNIFYVKNFLIHTSVYKLYTGVNMIIFDKFW